MPGHDGTGPAGMGSMTGRGVGYCTPGTTPVNTGIGVVYGGGRGRAFGGGRGFGRTSMYNPRGLLRPRYINSVVAPIPPADEAGMLKQGQGFLKTAINGIEKRIKDIEGKP